MYQMGAPTLTGDSLRLGILAGQRTIVFVETSAVDTCIVLFVLLYIYSWNGLLDGEEEISSCRESLGKQPGSIIDSNASPAQRQKV
jgi:hypothetical protein